MCGFWCRVRMQSCARVCVCVCVCVCVSEHRVGSRSLRSLSHSSEWESDSNIVSHYLHNSTSIIEAFFMHTWQYSVKIEYEVQRLLSCCGTQSSNSKQETGQRQREDIVYMLHVRMLLQRRAGDVCTMHFCVLQGQIPLKVDDPLRSD